jgi:hypothetical protein
MSGRAFQERRSEARLSDRSGRRQFDPVGVFAGILILALIIDSILDIAGKRLFKWRTSASERPA